jgi:hypothetical protein
MPLYPIPPDPEPTESERAAIEAAHPFLPEPREWFVRAEWRSQKEKENSDSFLAPFPPAGYRDYLAGDSWRRIKRKVLKAANHECACCEQRAKTLHHRDYRPRVLSGNDTTPLVPVCDDCHGKIDNFGGRPRSWQEKERILAEMVATKDRNEEMHELAPCTMLPSSADTCQICDVKHRLGEPHYVSLYYRVMFRDMVGRSPTLADAMAHCDEEMKRRWEAELRRRGVWTAPPDGEPPVIDHGV